MKSSRLTHLFHEENTLTDTLELDFQTTSLCPKYLHLQQVTTHTVAGDGMAKRSHFVLVFQKNNKKKLSSLHHCPYPSDKLHIPNLSLSESLSFCLSQSLSPLLSPLFHFHPLKAITGFLDLKASSPFVLKAFRVLSE